MYWKRKDIKLIKGVNAIGLVTKSGRYGGEITCSN